MVLCGVSSFGSGSFHEHTMPARHHSQVPHFVDHNDQYSFHDTHAACPPNDYVHTPATTEMAFTPWLEPPSTSMLSRTSSLTGSEYVPTPPPFIERPPMPTIPMMDHQLESSPDYLTRYSNHLEEHVLAWEQYLEGGSVLQRPLPEMAMSAWHTNNHGSTMQYYPEPFTNNVASPFIQPTLETRLVHRDNASSMPSYTESSASSSISDTDSSESEDSNSSYSKRKRPRSSPGSSRGASHKVPVLKLGKWDMASDPFSRPQQRHYVCGRIESDGSHERHCRRSFMRPEHLRRHIKTVHGEARDYICKLPQCRKAFSRGDNLREHYWTHIERGGRAGKNDKMTFAELKLVLGPKEKKLLRRLKHKLSDHQSKLPRQQLRMRIRSKL